MIKNYILYLWNFVLVTSVLYPLCTLSQSAPQFDWVKNCLSYYDGTTTYANYGTTICTDEYANNYTMGYFNGTIYYDTCVLSSAGKPAYYMISNDSSGNFRWAKQFPGNLPSFSADLVYDQAGHIYMTGEFKDSVSFDGINYFLSGPVSDYFIARFDTTGNFQWAKIMEPKATNGYISNIRLSVDNGHNIYAVGEYEDTLRINGSVMNIPATDNFYFAKIDSSGTMQFIKSGFVTNVANLQITIDFQKHIYISGSVVGTVNIQSVTMTGKGMFLAGFNDAGNYKWMNMALGNAVNGNRIQTIDNLLYVGGFYNDSLLIGTTTFYTPTINHNTFLAQFDTSGSFYWAKRIDVIAGNQIRINSMIASGNYVYVTGEFTKSLIFNGIQYTSTTPLGARDPWVAAYDNFGNEIWFKGAGSFHEDYGFDIDIDNAQNLYLTGATHFPSYFDNIILTDSAFGNNPINTFIARIGNGNYLSIPEISSSTQVLIYPNPLITQSTLSFSNPGNDKFTYTITDITGQVVEAGSTEKSEISITKGSKTAGVYLFNLMNEKTGESMNGKIVVCN